MSSPCAGSQTGFKRRKTITQIQVVLYVSFGVDIGERLRVARLQTLEKFDDLLLVTGHGEFLV